MKNDCSRIRRTLCSVLACLCLFLMCGCSDVQTPTVPDTTASDAATQSEPADADVTAGFGEDVRILPMDGIEIVSGSVEPVSGGMVYTPDPGSGFFTVNGTIAEDSMIAITIRPVGVLRYKLTLDAQEEKTVRTEIRVFKNDKMLVSCVQEETHLVKGENSIDVCIDTNEGHACSGVYNVRCYMDDRLVFGTDYHA